MANKRGQVTIFVIIAVVIIAAVVLYLVLYSNKTQIDNIPADLQPPYEAFIKCVEDKTLLGINILESQGGYIDVPNFEPGSSYMPFSNQLNFLGTSVPYWYYVSGNNIQKEQVPTRQSMEEELSRFVEDQILNCNYDSYKEQGFDVSQGPAQVEASISDDMINLVIKSNFGISKVGENVVVGEHEVEVLSGLGRLYSSALKVYEKEQTDMFLEEYGVDVMNLYAPVTGIELSCGPISWDAENVFDDISVALEANTQALKTKGNSDDYFYVDTGVSENVRFLNSRNWSSAYEVNPSEGRLLMAMPVGNQPGLGIMGFCYVPYHFVYNIRYPVLVQVYEGTEIFQFPVAVVILGNKAREPLSSIAIENQIVDFCEYKNTDVQVDVFDSSGVGVDADISYDCSGTVCYIGKTSGGSLVDKFPQCANGRIISRADDYKETSYSLSTVNSGLATILMERYYPLDVNLMVDGRNYLGEAIVSFSSNDVSQTILYPDQKTINLLPGEYNVTVYVYSNSSLDLGESVTEQCVDVPKGGLGGLIGLTEKKCFEVEIPSQIISKALSAGGHAKVYLLDSTLKRASGVYIDSQSLPKPDSLEQLQTNYILFDDKILEVDFK